MKIQTKKRQFFWAAFVGFFFWIFGSYLFHFQLYSPIEEGGITDFEEAFREKGNELHKEVENFAHFFPNDASR